MQIRHLTRLALIAAFAPLLAHAAPLPRQDVPDPLKSWVPWVMHGHEMLACPGAFNGAQQRACIWPSLLELQAMPSGATFRLEVQVFGAQAWVDLPGEPGRWPQALQLNGRPLAAAERDARPAALLPAGAHVVTGRLEWPRLPDDLALPRDTGSLRLSVNGQAVNRTPDADGRVWLQQSQSATQANDELTLRTSRLIDDDIPMRVTTHYAIAISGKPREIVLPAALLPGFVAESLESPLPARLQAQGQLRLQGRPGQWTVTIRARLMAPTNALVLPVGLADEIWSFVARNDLRLVSVEGLTSVDAKQVPIPDAWRAHPAFQVKAGQELRLVESRRGNPQPGADRLTLAREIWLDFNGQGYTMQDTIAGKLSRSWRLELASPGVLGRASSDGQDQAVTRRAGATADGVELRRGTLALSADSRVEGGQRSLPATGWLADFVSASSQLHLPPGWRLLHARGVDKAEGSWVSMWTLWDFFFVLLGALAGAKLFGPKVGALMAAMLVFTWHMPGAPQAAWLALLGGLALVRVLPEGRIARVSQWSTRVVAGGIALWLIPYAVEQVRLSLHPALEHPWMQVSDAQRVQQVAASRARAGGPAPAAPAPEVERDESSAADPRAPAALLKGEAREMLSSSGLADAKSRYAGAPPRRAMNEIDPSVKVQTGPGLPAWRWNSHALVWQGPVQAAQGLTLILLPPWGTVALRLGGLALMLAALWALLKAMPGWPPGMGTRRSPQSPLAPSAAQAPRAPGPHGATAGATSALALGVAAALMAASGAAMSASPNPTAGPATRGIATAAAPDSWPSDAVLEQLRNKLTAPPDCLPQCASVARLRVEAQGSRVQLRLEVHALADVMLPLPGQGANWRPNLISADAQAAVLRRDADGALWVAVRAGVSQLLLAADVGDATNVEIALPMPPREVTLNAPGWAVAGLDARGLASGALSLSRAASGTQSPDGGTQRDALPAFLSVERTVHLGLRWIVETRITRAAPSRAPVRARIRLLAGEAVNNETVRIEDGHAVVQLGAEDSAAFVSTLAESPKLELLSSREPNQIERWRLAPSAAWHVAWSGIAPVQYVDRTSGLLAPSWQPWPDEKVQLTIDKPVGTAGQTLTIDRLNLSVSPGLRATDVSSSATLRSSQGGNHRTQLPEGVEFLGLSLNGQSLPIQPQGRELLIPITPGEHTLKIDWREPRGMGWSFETTPYGLGAAGVNASTTIRPPAERVVLALGGPRIGPAVLFWGVLAALLVVAVGLGRSKLAPLNAAAWFLLGLGIAQTSLLGAAVFAGWFFALAARRRFANSAAGANAASVPSNLIQVLLLLWTVAAALVLLGAVRAGLLGYPDMMIAGNGSHAGELHWYQDRFADQLMPAWVISVPVLAYRLLMLLWALWLAASLLKWIKWAWECYSAGGYWRKRNKAAPPSTPDAAGADTAS
jgi:hypothetical protein